MGFYGNIKNNSRTQFSFDKTYASRAAMDNMAPRDGVYAGRYVLVEYDQQVSPTALPIGYLKDGIIYKTLPSQLGGSTLAYRLSNFVVTNEETGEGYWEKTVNEIVQPGTVIYIPVEYNFDEVYYKYGDEKDPTNKKPISTTEPRGIFLTITNQSDTKEVPVYKYHTEEKRLYTYYNQQGELIVHEVEYGKHIVFAPDNVSYTGTADGFPLEDGVTTSPSMDAYSNYIWNYNLDRSQYGVSRGYDSTVWQKVYENSTAKYVMVAELNSVVPTFDIEADAPSMVPILPHFDADSTNVYYKLHWQPQWGFRIKGSNPDQKTPELFTSGESRSDRYISARNDKKEYPSDATTTWVNHIYNSNNGMSTKKVFVTDDGNGTPYWMYPEDAAMYKNSEVPAAIYFNKDGFDPEKISFSWDKEYRDWNVKDNTEMKYLVTDEISISPTGQSGHLYNTHGTKFMQERVPDTQELSVMLPSIGDTIAQVWDLVYGGRNLDVDATKRKMDISWYNAKAVSNKDGVRLIESAGPGQYTYNPKAASTLAGVVNSAQDLMGMIITNEMPDDPSTANGDYIYYDSTTKKYYFKHKTYSFEEKIFENNQIPEDYNEYQGIELKPWNNQYFYVDTATKSAYEFIKENVYYPDRRYLEDGEVEAAMMPVEVTAEYSPNGEFFCRYSDVYPSTETSNGATYNYLTASYEEYDETKKYFVFTPSKEQLAENEAIYTPNTFYYVTYSPVLLTDVTYEPDTYYFVEFIDNLEVPHYALAKGETIEDNVDFYGDKVVNYYKRTYTLDTNLRKGEWIYYRVSPDAGVSSNAYYKENKRAIPTGTLAYRDYSAGTYYYKVPEVPSPEAVVEMINSVIYVRDDIVYASEAAFNAAGHEYYTIEKEYELVQGKDVIDINDDNVIQVSYMRDINDFKSGSFESGSGKDIFYTYVDNQNVVRYIEVNYNNYSRAYNPSTQQYEFIVMDYSLIGEPYRPHSYHYRIEDASHEKWGSYLIDESAKIVPNRTYYLFTPIEGKDYSGKTLENEHFYSANDYYIEYPEGSGVYIPATEDFDANQEYLDPSLKLYVLSDEEGIYNHGAEWPLEIKTIPPGVKLATREDVWEFSELPGFGDKISTLHGLLLRLHNYLNENDDLTRSTLTARGSLNLFNDLINRFSALVPEKFVIVDDYGRMHSTTHSTAQPLTFATLTSSKEPQDDWVKAAEENILIDINIDGNFKQPHLSITHSNANVIENTTTKFDMNDNESFAGVDTFDIETPLYDNAGHIVGKNTHTVTLPNSFKKISLKNSELVGDLDQNEVQIIADNSQDTLTFASNNKWIKVASEDNTLKIAHAIVGANYGELKDNQQDFTPAFNAKFKVPVITVDNAGHLTAITTEEIKIPGLEYKEDTTEFNDIVLNIDYSYDTTKDIGTFTERRGKVDELIIQDYLIENGSDAKLANTDKIHVAFAKLQSQINAMDLSVVGGQEGDYIVSVSENDGKVSAASAKLPSVTDTAVTGEFVSSVSERFGQISVSRVAFDPFITITDGTADAAPAINVTVNTKSGEAQALTIATTGVYGVTKLTNAYDNTNEQFAMTGLGIKNAFATLKVDNQTATASQTLKSWNEQDGIVTIEFQDILIANNNIATNAAIEMSKIANLNKTIEDINASITTLIGQEVDPIDTFTVHGINNKLNAIIGNSDDGIDKLTLYGLDSKINQTKVDIIGSNESNLTLLSLDSKITNIIGTENDPEENLSLMNISKRLDSTIGQEADEIETLSLHGLNNKIADIIGSEEDEISKITILNLLNRINELESIIKEQHPSVKFSWEIEETPEEGEEPTLSVD